MAHPPARSPAEQTMATRATMLRTVYTRSAHAESLRQAGGSRSLTMRG
jgi:hypothetical protein